MVIERGESLLKRNVGHVKRFIDAVLQASQPQKEVIQPPAQEPVTESVIRTDPEPTVSPQPVVPGMKEQTSLPRRSTRKRAEPSWLKDYVTVMENNNYCKC